MNIEFLAPDAIKIIAPAKLSAEDFIHLAPEVDEVIKRDVCHQYTTEQASRTNWNAAST